MSSERNAGQLFIVAADPTLDLRIWDFAQAVRCHRQVCPAGREPWVPGSTPTCTRHVDAATRSNVMDSGADTYTDQMVTDYCNMSTANAITGPYYYTYIGKLTW